MLNIHACRGGAKPEPTGLGAEMRAHFQAAVQEEVEKKYEGVSSCKRCLVVVTPFIYRCGRSQPWDCNHIGGRP